MRLRRALLIVPAFGAAFVCAASAPAPTPTSKAIPRPGAILKPGDGAQPIQTDSAGGKTGAPDLATLTNDVNSAYAVMLQALDAQCARLMKEPRARKQQLESQVKEINAQIETLKNQIETLQKQIQVPEESNKKSQAHRAEGSLAAKKRVSESLLDALRTVNQQIASLEKQCQKAKAELEKQKQKILADLKKAFENHKSPDQVRAMLTQLLSMLLSVQNELLSELSAAAPGPSPATPSR